ncbi:Uncharacterized protein OBRU01_02020 [Operophtera brumata]|uniref:Replication termination factor 2 n=1 Tax=Operophtera brumata TaxID=104452 RepID=A0A0L7LT80_OPEBR|nr:Uncharacterized protein OBRU01_02020 [Operophtera brumata]
MGCDGGTIPRRDELVRLKKKPEQKDKDAERSFKWRNCALSQQPLQQPVVACALGRLYSKSSDIKDLNLIKNPAYVPTDHTDGAVGEGNAPYICPISGIEMSGKFRFVFLWSCGCVLAERALKEVKQNLCHMCQTPFTSNDTVVLNGTDEDIELLREKMAIRVASRKNCKKSKSKADKTENVEVKAEPSTPSASDTTEIKEEKEVKIEPEAGPSTSNATKKVIEDTIPLSLPKFNPNKVARGHFGSSKRALTSTELQQDPSYKKTKKDYSVANDPQSSEVYKSLFTSHSDEKDQQRAHWVTYNPFYN